VSVWAGVIARNRVSACYASFSASVRWGTTRTIALVACFYRSCSGEDRGAPNSAIASCAGCRSPRAKLNFTPARENLSQAVCSTFGNCVELLPDAGIGITFPLWLNVVIDVACPAHFELQLLRVAMQSKFATRALK